MQSIRDYTGEIRLCGSCGQPAWLNAETDQWEHFAEQRKGVICPVFPLAQAVIAIEWDEMSLTTLRQNYSNRGWEPIETRLTAPPNSGQEPAEFDPTKVIHVESLSDLVVRCSDGTEIRFGDEVSMGEPIRGRLMTDGSTTYWESADGDRTEMPPL